MDSGKRKIIVIALVALLAVAVVAAAILLVGNNALKTTDASGTAVTMDKAPERIVSGSPEISETVAALGLVDKLVAVTEFCDYPAAVASLSANGSVIGGFSTPSFEKVISFNPDLVILNYGMEEQRALAAQLRNAGYTVLMVYSASDLATVYKNIEMVGNVTGTQAAAESLVSDLKVQVDAIAGAVASESKPNVLFVTYSEAGFTSVYPAGGGTSTGGIITAAGGTNAFADMGTYDMASSEVLTSKASTVDYIFLTMMYSKETAENKSAWFHSDSIWKESPAVKNNKVYYLTGQAENIFNRGSVRMVDAVQLMAEILHPEAFNSTVPFEAEGLNNIGDEYIGYIPAGTASQSASVTIVAAVARD